MKISEIYGCGAVSDLAPVVENVEASDDDGPELFDRFKAWFTTDRDHRHGWAEEAVQAYDMVAGRQWDNDAKRVLEESGRPATSFNRISPMIGIVCGLEVGNRQEVRFVPREEGDVAVNELLTEAARWVRDEGDAEDEESDAFRDMVVSGMGWTDTNLSYDQDTDGQLGIERIDPLEMYWDAGATKKNLSDARRLWRVRDVPLYEAKEMYPEESESDLNAGWATDIAATSISPHDATAAPFYRNDQGQNANKHRSLVRLVEVQWWEREEFYRFVDPLTGKQESMSEEDWERVRFRLRMMGVAEPYSVCQKKRVYWRAMLGAKVLQVWGGPEDGGFTWKALTGERDRNKGYWFGLVRCMIDPQVWANKWLSQAMHILNTGAKGGILAEMDAFEDQRKAEEDWADPEAIVFVTQGAISNQKIMPRPQNQMPPAIGELMQLAMSSIRDCTGINLELLGLVERDQPGIVEHARKQAGMTVLAGLFDALRRYRKDQGRLMLWYITNFLSDGRLIRIGGQDRAQYVPLLKQEGAVEYDVIVDDTPSSPNIKEKAWATLVQLMPFLTKLPVPPQVYLELLKYSPLPETVTTKIAKIIEDDEKQKQSQPPKDPRMLTAQSTVEMNQARARLAQAQAMKVQRDTELGSHAAEAEKMESQVQAMKLAMSGEETRAKIEEAKARVEQLRSAALLNVAKAEAEEAGQQTEQYLAVLDVLDTLASWKQAELDRKAESVH